METNRVRYTCSVLTSTTGTRSHAMWILTLAILALHVFSFVSRSWYPLYLDLDGCLTCGTLIVSVGTIFENSVYNVFADDDLDLYWDPHKHSDIIVDGDNIVDGGGLGVSLDGWRRGLEFRQAGEVMVEGGLYVHVGLWGVAVCLVDRSTCALVDHSASTLALRTMQPVADMLESAYDSRPFLVLACLSHLLLVFYSCLRPGRASVGHLRTSAAVEAFSAVFSLMAVVIAGMPYLTSSGFYHHVTPLFPWALLSTVLAGYLSCVLAYHTWHSQAPLQITSLRSWQAQQLYKYQV